MRCMVRSLFLCPESPLITSPSLFLRLSQVYMFIQEITRPFDTFKASDNECELCVEAREQRKLNLQPEVTRAAKEKVTPNTLIFIDHPRCGI